MNQLDVSPGDMAGRLERLQLAGTNFDYGSFPELDHLRPHQMSTVETSLEYVTGLTHDSLEDPRGASVLLPPGSGKTVGAIATVKALTLPDFSPRVLHLSPSKNIQGQTQRKYQEFAPDIDSWKWNPVTRRIDGTVCQMTYQALDRAIRNGFVDQFDPDIILADEEHHLINGAWASLVEALAVGRLSIGMTATPAYSAIKNIRRLFPEILIHRTFPEGVQEGFVSPVNSYLYRSNALSIADESGIAKDMLAALAIVSEYAKEGKVGIIACLPGGERAHARAFEALAPQFRIGSRALRLYSVDGSMRPNIVDDRVEALRENHIDALSYTSMLGEGTDIPELDYLVIAASTHSIVLAGQRLGRATRLGKITDVHEFYRPGTVSHLEAFNEPFDLGLRDDKPRSHTSRSNPVVPVLEGDNGPFKLSQKFTGEHLANAARSLAAQLGSKDLGALPELQQALETSVQSAPSYDWRTREQMAMATGLAIEEIDSVIAGMGVEPTTIEFGQYKREYYPADVMKVVLAKQGVGPMPEGTHISALEAYNDLKSRIGALGSYRSFMRLLSENGIDGSLFVDDLGSPVIAITIEALRIVPKLRLGDLKGIENIMNRRQHIKDLEKVEPIKELPAQAEDPKTTKPLEEMLEEFLVSLVPSRDDGPERSMQRQRDLAMLQAGLASSGEHLRPSDIEQLKAALARLNPDGAVLRNINSMAERANLLPIRVLGIMIRQISNAQS